MTQRMASTDQKLDEDPENRTEVNSDVCTLDLAKELSTQSTATLDSEEKYIPQIGIVAPIQDETSKSIPKAQPLNESLQSKQASLEMRKLPVNLLLKPSHVDNTSIISEDADNFHGKQGRPRDLIHRLCIRPSLGIKTQLMLSFGSINAITVTVVVIVCILITILAGEEIQNTNRTSFERLERESQVRTAKYLARSLDMRLIPHDEVNILREATMDRFQGYPDPTDDNVPFLDMETQKRIYPVIGSPVPFEWDLQPNVNTENYEEHFQKRAYWKDHLDEVSTLNAGFFMQGACDPSVDDRDAPTYWPVCTAANNDISVGGVVVPSPTTGQIHRKGSDLVPVLKAIFESKEELRDLGLYFANSGAGASVTYPQVPFNTSSTYTSSGCQWLLQPNPYDPTRLIGSEDAITQCHAAGTTVSYRAHNPLEREWCSRQALNPDQLIIVPELDTWKESKSWLLNIGKAMYDRDTREFIGCTHIGVSLAEIEDELEAASAITSGTLVSLILNNDVGTVVASSVADLAGQDIPVYEANLGLTRGVYEDLYMMVDFHSKWDPEEVVAKYESFAANDGTYLISTYPLPPVPEEYDPLYRPFSYVIISTAIDELFSGLYEVNEEVDERVKTLLLFTALAGAIGLVVATLVIFLMANVLTSPLNSMNRLASEIVSNFGDRSKEIRIEGANIAVRCSPRTELGDVVREFNRMVSSFSGKMLVKSEKGRCQEITNGFRLQREFADIYMSRKSPAFAYASEPPIEIRIALQGDDQIKYPHLGSNLVENPTLAASLPPLMKPTGVRLLSPLFLWVVCLIVTPLLLVNVTIMAVVMKTVSEEFYESVESAQLYFLSVQRRALLVHAVLRADYASALTRKSTRDAYLLTRYASWLLFEGLERSDSFPEIITGTEHCKNYSTDILQCPFAQEHYVCDCDWNENTFPFSCSNISENSRNLQVPFWASESRPTYSDGNRNSTLFPSASFSPESTAYWDNPFQLPGSGRGPNASGHETTYDRLRSISAIPLFQVYYNYEMVENSKIAAFVAFEADGLAFGYRGCGNLDHATWHAYRCRVEDASIRPDLCPEGKYGYDPRCRGWYAKGKRLAIEDDTFLHITAPYRFASLGLVAQTATAPLIDPQTKVHVGQVLVDFFSDPIYDELESQTFLSTEGFPLLVATQSDNNADTVIAPQFQRNQSATPISEQVLPNDYACNETLCKENIADFEIIVGSMKRGDIANVTFSRSQPDMSQEIVHMAFAPVAVTAFRPIDSGDFTRGVEVSTYFVYSLALAEPQASILRSFDPIEEATAKQIRIAIAVLSFLVAVATVVVTYLSHRVASSISDPMMYLLALIQSINSQGAPTVPSQSKTINSSREVTMFVQTMEMLYTLLRSANAAFYAGELELAHSILVDALRLFKRLGNKKAIGIANNNLGNVVFAMYHHAKLNNFPRMAGLSRFQLMKKGIAYYHEAIELGEVASEKFHEEQGWSPLCLEFGQHLANRYFNRGLFLLTVKNDHNNPSELEELGKRDLQIARDMDEEVLSYGEETGWTASDRVQKAFDNKVLRARGLNMIIEQGYTDEWEVKELLDEAFAIITRERQKGSSPLFVNMSVTGRMQDLETELLKYKRVTGDLASAAQIAVRMLMEDEIIFLDAESEAVKVLMEFIDNENGLDELVRAEISAELRNSLSTLEEVAKDQNMVSVSDLDSVISKSTAITASARRISSQVWSLKQCGGRFVTMEDF